MYLTYARFLAHLAHPESKVLAHGLEERSTSSHLKDQQCYLALLSTTNTSHTSPYHSVPKTNQKRPIPATISFANTLDPGNFGVWPSLLFPSPSTIARSACACACTVLSHSSPPNGPKDPRNLRKQKPTVPLDLFLLAFVTWASRCFVNCSNCTRSSWLFSYSRQSRCAGMLRLSPRSKRDVRK